MPDMPDLTRCLAEQAMALEVADWTAPHGSDAWGAALGYEDWLIEECWILRDQVRDATKEIGADGKYGK